MPKKIPQNAFYFFMKDLQNDYREGGRTPSMKEMAEIAHPLYKNLSREKKLSYENKAREAKTVRKDTDEGRYTSDGIPITQLLQEDRDNEREKNRILSEVKNFLVENIHNIKDTSIYIISFNILYATRDNSCYPNEVGLVNYKLQEGIVKSFHTFIDPGQIQQGYMSEAKLQSEKYHQIPFIMSDFELANNNYTNIFDSIIQFVNAHEGKKLIFCRKDQITQTMSCFQWLSKASLDNRYASNVEIADLSILLFYLFEIVNKQLGSEALADEKLLSSAYDYALNTRCTFHEDIDSCYCALGFSRKMCFLISDNLCQHFGVPLTSSHIPERPSEVVNMPLKSEKSYPNMIPASHLSAREVGRALSNSDDDLDDEFYCKLNLTKNQQPTANGRGGGSGSGK